MMMGSSSPRRWDPLRDVQREFGRLFETLDPLHAWRLPRPFPAVNLYEAADRFILTAEAPGMTPEELELTVAGDAVTLAGERRRPAGIVEESYRRQERPFGRWSRTISLPQRVVEEGVTAEFAAGRLVVELPKADPVRPRQIAIHTASGEPRPSPAEGAEEPRR